MKSLLYQFHFKALSSLARLRLLNVLRVRLRRRIPRRLDIILELESVILVMLLLTFAVPAQARSLSALEGLEALRRSFNGLQDFSADITQEKQLSIMKKKLVMQGTVRFKKPDRFYLELLPPYPGKVLLKDAVLEQRIGQQGELQRIVLPPEQGLSRWFATIAKPVSALPDGMGVRAELTSNQYTVVITPAGSGQLKELTIQFQADGTIRRLVLEERNGDRTVMTFRNSRRNTGLTEADFKLE